MKLVLIVEDEYGNAEVLQLLLEAEGYRVALASNGKQALDILRTGEQPDLILSDFMMPIMDGTQTLAAIRNNTAFAKIPVIMMSSLEEVSVRETGADYDRFLRKPFRAKAVLQTVAQLLEHPPRK